MGLLIAKIAKIGLQKTAHLIGVGAETFSEICIILH